MMSNYDKNPKMDAKILSRPLSLSADHADVQELLKDVDTKRPMGALLKEMPSHISANRSHLAAFIGQKIEFGAFVVRFDGTSARIVYANDDWAQWLGHAITQVEGTLLNKWLHTSHEQGMFLTPTIISETRFEQVSFVGPDKESLWANVHVIPYPDEPLTYACFVQDTKLKRELARELLYVQNMKQRHSIWQDVSRDVFNPLAAVKSNLTYALEHFNDVTTSSLIPDVLEAIEDAQQGLAHTIETLQTLMYDKHTMNSKDSSPDGSASLDTPFDPFQAYKEIDILDTSRLSEFSIIEADPFNSMLDGIISTVMASVVKQTKIIKQTEPNIQADNWIKPEIEKVLVDLLLYAHDMLRDGYDVELLAYTHDAHVCLSILFVNDYRDSDDMFGKTWGAHDLFGCHRMIMSKGGELNIEQDGPQQHISILLPKTVENAWRATSTADFPQRTDAHTPPKLLAKLVEQDTPHDTTILIIDDEDHVLTTVTDILKHTHNVVTMTSIQAAMAYIKTHDTPDVFVCDVLLAESNGFEFYGELIKQDRTLRKRLLFMSDNTQTSWIHDTAQALKAPMLRKPFTSNQLLFEVERLLPIP